MSKAVRRYEAGVERALGLFDTTNEWADYIAFLSRLHRALQAHPEGAEIPLKNAVSKCLAQCLNPSLPSGVHQKALEVYSLIFTILGSARLAQELALYLPGVSHTLAFASLSIRPLFLSLMRDHVLKVSPTALRPALKAILLSLLPGLEDESSEDFDLTMAIVNDARSIFARDDSEGFFWQSLFLASITSPGRRSGVFVYLARHLPKFPNRRTGPNTPHTSELEDSIQLILSPEPGLLIRCFAAGLLDEQILVQRNFLDLLVSHLPLGALVSSNAVVAKDIEILVSAAVSVVLRRDMSLNKRLWSWFTGPEAHDQAESNGQPLSFDKLGSAKDSIIGSVTTSNIPGYFPEYGLKPLTRSLEHMLDRNSASPSERARPFRIALSLMDRWEIGDPVVTVIFVPLMKNIQDYQQHAPSREAYEEAFRSANVFFDGVESSLIWTQMYELLQQGDLDLIDFVVSHFNLEEEEMLVVHMPLFCILLFNRIAAIRSTPTQPDSFSNKRLQTILSTVTSLTPERAYALGSQERALDMAIHGDPEQDIKKFYRAKGSASPPFSSVKLSSISSEASTHAYLVHLETRSPLLQDITQALVMLMSKMGPENMSWNRNAAEVWSFGRPPGDFAQERFLELGSTPDDQNDMFRKMLETMQELGDEADLGWIHVLTASIVSIIVAISTKIHMGEKLLGLVRVVVHQVWRTLLSHATPQFHVESSRHLSALSTITRETRVVESALMTEMTNTSHASYKIERFAALWSHTAKEDLRNLMRKPLLTIVDMLFLQKEISEPGREWLQLLPFSSLCSVYDMILETKTCLGRLHVVLTLQTDEQWQAFSTEAGISQKISSRAIESLSNKNTLTSGDTESAEDLAALAVIRLLNTHGSLPEDNNVIISRLTKILQATAEGSELQYSVVETLQNFTERHNSPYSDELLACLLEGISSTVDESIDKWMSLTCSVILLYDEAIFQVLLQVTDCFCGRLDLSLASIRSMFTLENSTERVKNPEKLIANLLGGLEYVLARAHQKLGDRERINTLKGPEQGPGFFGNIAVGASQPAIEANQIRSSLANNHLTVILCFQDTVKLCFRYWSWGSSTYISAAGTQASFYHTSSRIRSRTRRILDNLLEAEPQECLETLMGLWANFRRKNMPLDVKLVLNLLQSLKGGRPRLTLPTTFNAIYNRTNPAALDKSQRSTLSTDLSTSDLALFLIEYVSSLEDDLLEEIWVDCTTFLRDILANPMPHRQILIHLVEIVAVMCSKIENTNFGEEWKMRRELGDLCLRLFTAIFTVKPGGLENMVQTQKDLERRASTNQSGSIFETRNILQVLCKTLPALSNVLTDSDRLATVLTGITTNITGPLLHSKLFPQTVTLDTLILLQVMSRAASASKGWRRDTSDGFNDSRFFNSPVGVIKPGWLPLLQQLLLADKSLMTEILSRLTPPTTAGIVFGVGASAARTESDKKTQLNLKRLSILFLAAEYDSFAGNVGQVHAKIEQLLLATKESSPSSGIRADIYMLLRSMILTTSPVHLSSLWATIDTELRDVLTSMTEHLDNYSAPSRLQAAKLLDLLLLIKPDEFQLHEWLFVTDTVDVIYPPAKWTSSALSDLVAQDGAESVLPVSSQYKRPWLCSDSTRNTPMEEIDSILKPFFSQLSIHAFEDVYSLAPVDSGVCIDDLIADLFS